MKRAKTAKRSPKSARLCKPHQEKEGGHCLCCAGWQGFPSGRRRARSYKICQEVTKRVTVYAALRSVEVGLDRTEKIPILVPADRHEIRGYPIASGIIEVARRLASKPYPFAMYRSYHIWNMSNVHTCLRLSLFLARCSRKT